MPGAISAGRSGRLPGTISRCPSCPRSRRGADSSIRSSERSRSSRPGPAHIATLKTFDPPLTALDGEGLRGVERRAKRFLLPTDDGELVLMVHLMSAGRLKYVPKGGKGAKTPMFRLRFVDGGELQLTEAGSKKRAGVWLLRPDSWRRRSSRISGRRRTSSTPTTSRASSRRTRAGCHSLLRDQRLIAGIGRAWANEILWVAQLSPYALSTQVAGDELERLDGGDPRRSWTAASSCASPARTTTKTYRVHNKLGRPCERCGTPIARVDFEEHTIYYCPSCQTGGRVLKDRRLSRLLK